MYLIRKQLFKVISRINCHMGKHLFISLMDLYFMVKYPNLMPSVKAYIYIQMAPSTKVALKTQNLVDMGVYVIGKIRLNIWVPSRKENLMGKVHNCMKRDPVMMVSTLMELGKGRECMYGKMEIRMRANLKMAYLMGGEKSIKMNKFILKVNLKVELKQVSVSYINLG